MGRFLTVDPVEGGVDNNYVYPPDGVNDFNLTGTIGWKKWAKDRGRNIASIQKKTSNWAQQHPKQYEIASNIAIIGLSRGQARGGSRGGGRGTLAPKAITEKLILRKQAAELGYTKRVPAQKLPFDSHGQPGYMNKKGNYITPDRDAHKGGAWKVFKKNGQRDGTYDSTLKNRLGD